MFCCLELLEQLYRDGKIPSFMFRNMLSDYADIVDESLFIKGNHNHKEKIAR